MLQIMNDLFVSVTWISHHSSHMMFEKAVLKNSFQSFKINCRLLKCLNYFKFFKHYNNKWLIFRRDFQIDLNMKGLYILFIWFNFLTLRSAFCSRKSGILSTVSWLVWASRNNTVMFRKTGSYWAEQNAEKEGKIRITVSPNKQHFECLLIDCIIFISVTLTGA